ncbi:MAG: hypothetical protein HN577_08305, partial [Rhodospirillaceae bacterium]|nr:hypothetical protein [Rhodospirillaceae bacterium]
MPSTTDSAQPEAAGEFVEQAPHEAGFASIYTEMVAPHLGGLQRARERAVKRRRLQVVAGITIIFLIWMGVWLWGIGGVHFLILLIAGLLSLVTADLLLRRGTQPHRRTATMLRDLLIKAVCEQVEGLVYQRVAGRKVNHDRLVALSLAPRHATALIENFFGATRHTMAFRAVQASLRNNHRQEIFRGLLIEVDLPEPFDGRIVLARRDEPPRDDIAWEPPPGGVIDLKG